MKFVKDWNILYDQQYGFRSKHSTKHAILDIVNTILRNPRSKGPRSPFSFSDSPYDFEMKTREQNRNNPLQDRKLRPQPFPEISL